MNNNARFTNGTYELPRHARGVSRVGVVPPGERGLITSDGQAIVLKDPKHPEKGWTLR